MKNKIKCQDTTQEKVVHTYEVDRTGIIKCRAIKSHKLQCDIHSLKHGSVCFLLEMANINGKYLRATFSLMGRYKVIPPKEP
jgi:hypothetical protein